MWRYWTTELWASVARVGLLYQQLHIFTRRRDLDTMQFPLRCRLSDSAASPTLCLTSLLGCHQQGVHTRCALPSSSTLRSFIIARTSSVGTWSGLVVVKSKWLATGKSTGRIRRFSSMTLAGNLFVLFVAIQPSLFYKQNLRRVVAS